MSSIQDFFSKSFGGVSDPITRITHGTTYQRWTFGCCSSCCQCIPTSTDYYAYEMWGQGAGGAYGRCCQGGIEGGSGSGSAGVRIDYLACSSNRQMCFAHVVVIAAAMAINAAATADNLVDCVYVV